MHPQFDGTTGLLLGIGVEKAAIAILTLIILIIAIAFIWSSGSPRSTTTTADSPAAGSARTAGETGPRSYTSRNRRPGRKHTGKRTDTARRCTHTNPAAATTGTSHPKRHDHRKELQQETAAPETGARPHKKPRLNQDFRDCGRARGGNSTSAPSASSLRLLPCAYPGIGKQKGREEKWGTIGRRTSDGIASPERGYHHRSFKTGLWE